MLKILLLLFTKQIYLFIVILNISFIYIRISCCIISLHKCWEVYHSTMYFFYIIHFTFLISVSDTVQVCTMVLIYIEISNGSTSYIYFNILKNQIGRTHITQGFGNILTLFNVSSLY